MCQQLIDKVPDGSDYLLKVVMPFWPRSRGNPMQAGTQPLFRCDSHACFATAEQGTQILVPRIQAQPIDQLVNQGCPLHIGGIGSGTEGALNPRLMLRLHF